MNVIKVNSEALIMMCSEYELDVFDVLNKLDVSTLDYNRVASTLKQIEEELQP